MFLKKILALGVLGAFTGASACQVVLSKAYIDVTALINPYTIEASLDCSATGGNAKEPIATVTATMSANASALADIEAEIVIVPPSVTVTGRKGARHTTPGLVEEAASAHRRVTGFNFTGTSAVVTMKLYGMDQDSGQSLLAGPVVLSVTLTAAGDGGEAVTGTLPVRPAFPYGTETFEAATYMGQGSGFSPSNDVDSTPIMIACGPAGGVESVATGTVQINIPGDRTGREDYQLSVPRLTVFNRTSGHVETVEDPLGEGKARLPGGLTLSLATPPVLFMYSMKSTGANVSAGENIEVTIETLISDDMIRYAPGYVSISRIDGACPARANCTAENATRVVADIGVGETIATDLTLRCPPGVSVLSKKVVFMDGTHGTYDINAGTALTAQAGLYIGQSPGTLQLQMSDSTGASHFRTIELRETFPDHIPRRAAVTSSPESYQHSGQAMAYPYYPQTDGVKQTVTVELNYVSTLTGDTTRAVLKSATFNFKRAAPITVSATVFGPAESDLIVESGITWVFVAPGGVVGPSVYVDIDTAKLAAFRFPLMNVGPSFVTLEFVLESNIFDYTGPNALSSRFITFATHTQPLPSSSPSGQPSGTPTPSPGGGGLAPWGLALIIIFSLGGVGVLGFIGYRFHARGKSRRYGDTVPHGSNYGALDA